MKRGEIYYVNLSPMKLSSKAIRLIIEVLDYRINAYQEHLKLENLDEDEVSDITNDSMFLEALREEMAKTLVKSA